MPFLDIEGISSEAKTAQLQTIAFWKLLDGDLEEVDRLVAACEHYGFFYLDLNGKGSRDMLQNLDQLRALMKGWFAQPLEKKLQTETLSNSHGYKPVGIQTGISKDTKDGWEAIKIGRDELRGRWALPSVVKANQQLFDEFSASSHYVLKILLDCISSGLGTFENQDTNLHRFHRDDEPSKSTLYFLHYPASALSQEQRGVGQNMHTDVGTLTLLFAPQWGLQALSPSTGEWEWVEPRAGHAVINVGDTLRFLTGRRFRSALHRAVPVEGIDRFSISYFLRASDRTEFRDSDNAASDAKTWFLKKYAMYEEPHEVQKLDSTLTGGMIQELTKV